MRSSNPHTVHNYISRENSDKIRNLRDECHVSVKDRITKVGNLWLSDYLKTHLKMQEIVFQRHQKSMDMLDIYIASCD